MRQLKDELFDDLDEGPVSLYCNGTDVTVEALRSILGNLVAQGKGKLVVKLGEPDGTYSAARTVHYDEAEEAVLLV